MADAIGPTPGQKIELIRLHLNPDEYANTPQSEIAALIGREGKTANYAVSRDRMMQAWQTERQGTIIEQGFEPGMGVLRKSHRREGDTTEIPDVIIEITPDWRVQLQGVSKPVNPSQIRPMP